MIMKCHKCKKEISKFEFENDAVISNEWLMMSSYKKSNKKKA